MTLMKVPRPRATIVDAPGGLEIKIPARRNVFMVAFLSVWLTGWALGWILALRQLISGRLHNSADQFLVVWFVAWTLAGVFALVVVLWMTAGRERIVLGSDTLVLRREALGLGLSREYPLADVRNLRASPQVLVPRAYSSGLQFWGLAGGAIAFDFGPSTIRFGQVEEGEAETIVKQLRARHSFPESG